MHRSILPVAGVAAAALGAAPAAHAAAIFTDRPCYVETQPMVIAGNGFAPNANWSVETDQLFAFGTTTTIGTFASNTETAPIVVERTTRPKTFTLTAKQEGAPVAQLNFDVVNLMVSLAETRGKPTGSTKWRFSGFTPGQSIYVHVRRGGRTLANSRAGKGDSRCGRLTRTLRRLPGVSKHRIHSGLYDVYIDNRRHFSRTARPQFRGSLTVFSRFLHR